jgi:hypothetical protein
MGELPYLRNALPEKGTSDDLLFPRLLGSVAAPAYRSTPRPDPWQRAAAPVSDDRRPLGPGVQGDTAKTAKAAVQLAPDSGPPRYHAGAPGAGGVNAKGLCNPPQVQRPPMRGCASTLVRNLLSIILIRSSENENTPPKRGATRYHSPSSWGGVISSVNHFGWLSEN